MPILAAHVIISTYGFWLPNDPRCSWSEFVAAWELLRFGRATKVTTRASVAHVPHNRSLRYAAKKSLKYDAVCLTGYQARAVARGFADAAEEGGYPIHACSILPDHVHFVIGTHGRVFEKITAHLKARATRQLRLEQLHPFRAFEDADGSVPSVWARKLWKVYCNDAKHVRNAIRYVEDNPLREGKRKQSWNFVSAFER